MHMQESTDECINECGGGNRHFSLPTLFLFLKSIKIKKKPSGDTQAWRSQPAKETSLPPHCSVFLQPLRDRKTQSPEGPVWSLRPCSLLCTNIYVEWGPGTATRVFSFCKHHVHSYPSALILYLPVSEPGWVGPGLQGNLTLSIGHSAWQSEAPLWP